MSAMTGKERADREAALFEAARFSAWLKSYDHHGRYLISTGGDVTGYPYSHWLDKHYKNFIKTGVSYEQG